MKDLLDLLQMLYKRFEDIPELNLTPDDVEMAQREVETMFIKIADIVHIKCQRGL